MRRAFYFAFALAAIVLAWKTEHQLFQAPVLTAVVVTCYWTLLESIPSAFWQRHDLLRTTVSNVSDTLTMRVFFGPIGIWFMLGSFSFAAISAMTTNAYWLMSYWMFAGVVVGTDIIVGDEEAQANHPTQLEVSTQ